MKKRFSALIMAAVLCLFPPQALMMAVLAQSSSTAYTFDISEGNITVAADTSQNTLKVTYGSGSPQETFYNIPDTQPITITGATTTNTVAINAAGTVNIMLNGTDISVEACPFSIASDTTVNLTVYGTNKLNAGNSNFAGMCVPSGATLNVTAGSTGLLAAKCNYGAGIGGTGTSSGMIGDKSGNVTVSGGTVMATSYYGAGIGGGCGLGLGGFGGFGGNVTISGGTVTATSSFGAGIGGGVSGTGGYGGSGGKVTISGGTVTATGGKGAGIGGGGAGTGGYGGFGGTGDTVTISGGTVTATGQSGAGIGGGGGYDVGGSGGNVTVSGGMVTATSVSGAGIGGGNGQQGGYGNNLIISGGTIMATSSNAGGIGGGSGFGFGPIGNAGGNGNVTINGGSINAVTSANVYNSSGTQEYPVTVTGLPANEAISYTVDGGSAVSCFADADSKLYLWLPAALTNIRITSADGTAYDASGTVQTAGSNIFQAITDVDALADTKVLLATAMLNPVEGTDMNIITKTQSVADVIYSGITVTIDSSANSQIAGNGTITYGSSSVTGNVTFRLTKNAATDTQVLSITVPAHIATDADKVEADKAVLQIGFAAGDSASAVTQNLNLSVTGAVYGSAITWASNNTAVISNSGTVTRPAFSSWDADVTVTASIYSNGTGDTKAFDLKVLKLEPSTHTVSVSSSPSTGGSVSGGGTYNAGDSVTVTASVYSGYSFVSWTENNIQVSADAAYTFTLGPASRNLTANFIETPPVITTGAIAGTVTDGMDPVSGATVSLTVSGSMYSAATDPNGAFTITGIPAGTGYTVTAGKAGYTGGSATNVSVVANTTTSGVNITLSAIPVTYTVTFNKNGGDTDAGPTTETTAAGGNVGALPAAPTKAGYAFSGWNTAADGSGTVFTAGTAVTGNITVYAQWTQNLLTLVMTPGHATAGDVIDISGTTTAPAAVTISVIKADGTAVYTANTTSGADGGFTGSFTVPSDMTTGILYGRVSADSGSATANVTVYDMSKPHTLPAEINTPAVTVSGDGSNKNLELPATASSTSAPISVSVPAAVTDATVNVSKLVNAPINGVVTTRPLPAMSISATTAASARPVRIEIPSGATVSAPASANWDGTINVPTVKASNAVAVSADAGKTATVNTVIEVGFGDIPLTFSKAVRLLIPGMAGKDAGYYRANTFTRIARILSADSQSIADAEIPADGDARIDVGSDMVIWTKHFTSFVAYTQTITGSTGGGSSGRGRGSQAAPLPSAQIVIDPNGNVSVTVSPNLNKDTGTASVQVDTSTLTGAFEKAAADGVKTVAIEIPGMEGAKAYEPTLPASFLAAGDATRAVKIKTVIATVTVPGNMLTAANATGAQNVSLAIASGDRSKLDAAVQAQIGGRPVIELNLKVDGKQTAWSNDSAPVTVTIPYTPTAEELTNPESIVIWYIDSNGKSVSVPNGHYDAATGIVTFTTTHFSDYAVSYNPVSFSDVAAGAWYNKAVDFIAAREITTGMGNGNYSPDAKLTRGDFLVLLMKAYGIAPDTSSKDSFADAGNTYYTGYLAAAKRLGISGGVGNNMFAPSKEITRQEMFTLLYNALKVIGRLPQRNSGKSLSAFSDAEEIASWAKDAMTVLVETGTIGGNNGKLFPASTMTRAEMAQVLYNLLFK